MRHKLHQVTARETPGERLEGWVDLCILGAAVFVIFFCLGCSVFWNCPVKL